MKAQLFAVALFALIGGAAVAQEPAAAPRPTFDILGALPHNPQDGTRVEVALVYRDLRLYERAVAKQRKTLKQTSLGAAFYGEGAQVQAFGFDPLAEVVRLIDLASPQGNPVPAGLVAFNSPTGVGVQLLMKVEPGFLDRIAEALGSADPPPAPGEVREGALVIQIEEMTLTGRVGEDGWFRMAPNEGMLVGGQGRNPFSHAMGQWTRDLDGLLFLQGGGIATSRLAAEASGVLSQLLQSMRSAAVGWRFDGQRTWTTRLLVDIPQLENLVATARRPGLNNSLARIWDDDAAGFFSLSLPPPLTAALVPLIERELAGNGVEFPEALKNGLAGMDGRIGVVSFASPGDSAVGIGFRDAATAQAMVPALQQWIPTLSEKLEMDLSEEIILEQLPAGAGHVLHMRADTGLEGWRAAAVDNTVVMTRKHRLAALVEKARATAAGEPEGSLVAGPVTAPIRESLDTPAMLLGYLLLSTDGSMFEYLSWATSNLEQMWKQLEKELPALEIGHRFLARLPTYMALEGITWSMMYDAALSADLQRSLLIVQLHNSEI
jgi:hypothetical protein